MRFFQFDAKKCRQALGVQPGECGWIETCSDLPVKPNGMVKGRDGQCYEVMYDENDANWVIEVSKDVYTQLLNKQLKGKL